MNEICIRIKQLRKNFLKMSQEEFADAIGISRSNIGNIETGRVNVTDRNIEQICKEFGISESWLRDGVGDMIPDLSADEEYAKATTDLRIDKDDRAMKIIVNYWKLSPENKKAFWSLIDELTEGINKEKKQEQD